MCWQRTNRQIVVTDGQLNTVEKRHKRDKVTIYVAVKLILTLRIYSMICFRGTCQSTVFCLVSCLAFLYYFYVNK